MQKSSTTLLVTIAFLSLFFINKINGQTTFKAIETLPVLTITGTSTLHGWTVTANQVTDFPNELSVTIENGKSIDNFAFSVPIKQMDGGRGSSMNAKITGALKASNHPTISYQQTESAIIQDLDAAGNFTLISKGIVNIIGQEKPMEIAVSGQKTADGQLILKGSQKMKFSDYSIEPPSAMFGQIICGDDIAVNFEFVYQVNQ